jgi:FAD/FMN-containing dehydrogenase
MHSRSVTRVLQLVARLLPRTFNALVPCIIGYVVFRTLRAHQKAKVHSPSTSNYIWSNWEGSVTSVPGQVLYPASVEELRSIVIAANANLRKIKVFGGKHSWSAIARPDPGAIALSLDKLNKVLEFDEKKGEVFVEGGIRLKELHKQLFSRGYALPVLGSISEQSWVSFSCEANYELRISLSLFISRQEC